MDAVNRVVFVILLLVAMVLCTVVMVVPVWVFDAVARQSAALVDYLSSQPLYVLLPLGIIFAVVLDIIFIFLIYLEVRRPARKSIRVEKAAGGEVLVSVASIADRMKYEVDQLSSILRTRPSVSGKRGGVVVELDVETATGVNVPEKAEQIVETARQVVEEKMGLKLARPPRVNLRVVPYPKTPQPPAGLRERPKEKPKEKPGEELPVLPEDYPKDSEELL
jgi:hypothetical protein